MSHAILISDHDFLTETLKVNLQVYLTCKVVVIKDVPTLMQLVSIDQTYDFILCLSSILKKDISTEVYKVHQKYIKNAPLIFLGHVKDIPSGAFNVVNPFEILSIVRLVAKELNWTAKDLISRVSPEFIPIPMQLIKESKVAIDDLYWNSCNTSEPFTLVANYQDDIQKKAIAWSNNNVTQLYIRAENRLRAMNILNKSLIKSLNTALENPQIADVEKIQSSADLFASYFSDAESIHQLSEEVRVDLGTLANKTTQLVAQLTFKVPANLTKMIELFKKSPSEFIPRHSFLATYFAIEMVKSESWYSAQVEEKLCMLLFFHDIILLPLYQKYPELPDDEEEIMNSQLINEKEKQLFKWHPQLIAQMVSQIPGLPVGLDQLILQHHGTLNGDAHSKEMQEDVSILAKVVMVAEHFAVQLLKSKLPLKNETREVILRNLGEKFKRRSYLKLLGLLEKFEI